MWLLLSLKARRRWLDWGKEGQHPLRFGLTLKHLVGRGHIEHIQSGTRKANIRKPGVLGLRDDPDYPSGLVANLDPSMGGDIKPPLSVDRHSIRAAA